MNLPGSELRQMPGETGTRPLKANKACVPCRVRKVKCDASVIGLPCSSCTSRQYAKGCVLPTRKSRAKKEIRASSIPEGVRSTPTLDTSNSSQVGSLDQSERSNKSEEPKRANRSSILNANDTQKTHRDEPDLLYLNILNDAVKEATESSRPPTPSNTSYFLSSGDSLPFRNSLWTKLPQLDDFSNEYLIKKGVFNLPPPYYLDALIKTYFEHVYPFTPVINRVDFIRGYQTRTCSLFLLLVILTTASIHVPADVLSACGFSSRSAAQESFFSRAKLLYDFAVEDDPLLLLQGSLILSVVILDHPSDRDFRYWFHNAIRLATKVGLRDRCVREDQPPKLMRLYRRIWWSLYSLDIFHVFVNTTSHMRLLGNVSTINPTTEDDAEKEDDSLGSSSLLSRITRQQKAAPVAQCELSQISGELLSILTNEPQQDPCQIMHPLDTWRKSLAIKMHMDEDIANDVYYLNLQAMSYRFECILCRQIRHRCQNSQRAQWSEWAKQRLQSAVVELDTIVMRVLVRGNLQDFPISFVTTIPALLALHIESALDSAETDLARSMARISISQAMLVLAYGREIPALRRALPVFEEILARKNLYLVPSNIHGQDSMQSQSQDSTMADAYALSNAQGNAIPSGIEQCENDSIFYGDFLGLEFLDDWRVGSWASPVGVDMVSQEQNRYRYP